MSVHVENMLGEIVITERNIDCRNSYEGERSDESSKKMVNEVHVAVEIFVEDKHECVIVEEIADRKCHGKFSHRTARGAHVGLPIRASREKRITS